MVPCGIPYRCSHSGEKMGVVYGTLPREQVERMLKLALETPERTMAAYQRAVAAYDRETAATFENARTFAEGRAVQFPRRPAEPV